jgi:protein phosphatase
MVTEARLHQSLSALGGRELESVADALVDLANIYGGVDNITLALMRVGERQLVVSDGRNQDVQLP